MVKIFIDPGHGGTDSGATGNGLQEKAVTLEIALALRTILTNEYEGVSVTMSRTSDKTVSLTERTDAANSWGADYFLSIHINSGGGTGFESYIYPGVGAPTSTYQSAVHTQVIQASGFNDRGKKTANFHVLRETSMPAILTENGFVDTSADANKLKTASFIESLARGHAKGLEQAFGLKKKADLYKVQIGAFKVKANADALAADAVSKGFDAIVLPKGGLFKVQIGAFSSKDNAEALAARAEKAGFDAFIVQD
ncbi:MULTISPECIES: N-acetylmuramoyl-L-alanine amidase [Bacillus]|uniref:N-acetylmuramoyl-L-alanine amidase n=1 Tax=Bacillus amyloliquefaciens TaxID=1390 RepID=A0AAP3YGM7_BACAM|nr:MULTISPECIES: N-acetylmuramoyl-L-alanine amidase [Bacillus]AWM44224.1 N-acetylmuramoyl-L-alanine amidase [Bacillus amyloliquefaciens]KAF6537417.1 N-acetylmuramoyl-L-alanine amidase [Bacillus sp. EKM208B]MBM7028235.1 N-acetylmuramoyl-L-alanine amidase [Bacillus velezensis]MBU0443119.1 N-acetylmuramoyl-L-alanine amidase [Bacillus amyloliquefaciens]MCX2735341.1 N-acetylmuramoyl-L-alanine amidase [Bacillus sp. AnS8]